MAALVFNRGGIATAQPASPGARGNVPDPSECTVAPRSVDELRRLFEAVAAATPASGAAATPTAFVPPTGGTPADAATVAAVTDTLREIIACVNAGDIPRAFALQTDNKLRGDFAQDVSQGVTADQLVQYVAVASPVPAQNWVAVPTLSDVRVLDDGRVTARVFSQDQGNAFAIFVKQGDRWLLDVLENVPSSATPAAGS
jgi:hypothetical protein